jgi:hypothetical protein
MKLYYMYPVISFILLASGNRIHPIMPDGTKLPEQKEYHPETLDLENIPDTKVMYLVAKDYMPQYAVFFTALKMEESGAGSRHSYLARKFNNLVGMRYPRSRRTYAIGSTNTNYAIYRNWFESMMDFKIYIENIEARFEQKHKRKFRDEYEMLESLYSRYNIYDKWRQDMYFLIRYVKRNYVPDEVNLEEND